MPSLCHHIGDVASGCHRFGVSNHLENGDKVRRKLEDARTVAKGKFPNGVAAAMDAAVVKQSELARRIEESRQQVGRIVNGERKLTLPMALKIASALKCDARDLFIPEGTLTGDPMDSGFKPTQDLAAAKAQILDQISVLNPDEQAEVLSEALAVLARSGRSSG